MCKPSKPKAPKVAEPVYLTNPILDGNRDTQGASLAARAGRSSLRIPLNNGLGIGFSGRGGSAGGSATAGPRGNSRRSAQGMSPGGSTRLTRTPGPSAGRNAARRGGGGGSRGAGPRPQAH